METLDIDVSTAKSGLKAGRGRRSESQNGSTPTRDEEKTRGTEEVAESDAGSDG